MDSYDLPIKATARALTFFHDRLQDCVLVLNSHEDAVKASDYAITDLFSNLGRDECILYLCDGGVSRAIESKTTYGGTFLRWRYVLNLSGKVLNKLGRKRKWLKREDVASPLIVSAASHLAKQVKRKILDLNGGRITTTVLGMKRDFKVKRCVMYSRYLFLRSPMYKLFILGELRRNGIPVTCICTDGDSQAIQMLKGGLKTDNVFGFTNDTANLLAKDAKAKLPDEYRAFKLEDSISVPSLYPNAEVRMKEARLAIARAKMEDESPILRARVKEMLLVTTREYNNIRACSLPPTHVKQFSTTLGQLRGFVPMLSEASAEAMENKTQYLYQAATSLGSALDIIMAQIPNEEKFNKIRTFVQENPKTRMIPWTRFEGDALSAALGIDVVYQASNSEAGVVLFGGLLSTWQMLERIRKNHPAQVKLIGWDIESLEYDSFRQRYHEASDLLYRYDKDLALRISSEMSSNSTVVKKG